LVLRPKASVLKLTSHPNFSATKSAFTGQAFGELLDYALRNPVRLTNSPPRRLETRLRSHRATIPGLHGEFRRHKVEPQFQATFIWLATSPSASARSGVSAIWGAATHGSRKMRSACRFHISFWQHADARRAAHQRSLAAPHWIWIDPRSQRHPSARAVRSNSGKILSERLTINADKDTSIVRLAFDEFAMCRR